MSIAQKLVRPGTDNSVAPTQVVPPGAGNEIQTTEPQLVGAFAFFDAYANSAPRSSWL